MFYHDVNEEDFVELLFALPGGSANVREELLDKFGLLVGSDDPLDWWRKLESDRGEQGAAKAVAELVISMGGKRLLAMIKAEARDEDVYTRADDSQLIRLLFDEDEDWERLDLRGFIVEYYTTSRSFVDEEDESLPPEEEAVGIVVDEDERPKADDDPNIFDLFSGTPRPSAQRGAEWALERVQVPRRGFLSLTQGVTERDLEDFLWVNWEKIDFGFDRPIYLIGRQESLTPGTRDRVDLLEKGRSHERYAIELKIGEARSGDYTQLMSYMGNLENSGTPHDKVRGILIAPSFSNKVLNSAAIEPRVTLLRFHKDQ